MTIKSDGPLQCCCACRLWAVGRWLGVVAVVALVAVVAAVAAAAFGGAAGNGGSSSGAGAKKWCCCQSYLLLVLLALLVLGLMWCCKGSFNMKEWLSHVFTTAGLGQLNLFSSTLGWSDRGSK